MASSINFCENDVFLYGIGEPYNVLSSLVITFLGMYGLLIETIFEYQILYTLLLLIGLGSAYFHSKLTEFSHWVDIIIISCILVFSLWCIDETKNIIKYILLFILHLITSIFYPVIHVFILFITGFIVHYVISYKINNNINQISLNDYKTIKYLFYLSLICWIIDYACCYYINPFHTHWIFHILIGIVSYKIINLVKIVNGCRTND
jgi:hypothetical protein